MSDVSIQQAGVIDPYRHNTMKVVPSYLVSLEKGKGISFFIATKFEDAFTHCAKFVGFYYDGTLEEIVSRYDEIIKTMDPANFVEILFPWNKISSIRSLIYKHKTSNK